MGLVKGGFQRLLQTGLYLLAFLCMAIALGIYSYFLSVLADRNEFIPKWEKAVEGISGAGVLYTAAATILTCCLGGVTFFASIAILLDILFCGGSLAIAILARHGAGSCKGTVDTPIGTGSASSDNGFGKGTDDHIVYSVHLGLACRLNTVVFAVSIIAAFLFLCTAAMQVALIRHHKKEKRFGPSPSNNYTSGPGKRRFGFGRKDRNSARQAEAGGMVRPSGDTGYTGSTVAGGALAHDKAETQNDGYGHGAYHTAPTGTAVQNPYGYNNTATNY